MSDFIKEVKAIKKKVSPDGTNWADLRNEIITPEEIAESNLRVALVGEIIKGR